MSSLLAEKLGAQRPRWKSLPADRVGSDGLDCVEFAASAGLVLDDWQAWIVDQALGFRSDGLWSAFEVCLLVGRQNGKGSILEALELYHLFVLGTRTILHSAHEFKTAREHFDRLRLLIEASDELMESVAHIHTSNGNESIRLKNGCRIKFVARSKGSGRGFSGDLVILDEAYELPEQAIGAMGPILSAMPNPQVWYTSSAPHKDSHVLHSVRNRGLEGSSARLFFADWGNPLGTDSDDFEALLAANPGYPHRLTPDNLEAERDMMAGVPDEYLRERLGVAEPEETVGSLFPPGVWAACADKSSRAERPQLALDVAPGMAHASFCLAGKRADGSIHIELLDRRSGTDWVVEEAAALVSKYGTSIRATPRGPVTGLFDALNDARVPLEVVKEDHYTRACATFQERVLTGTVRHLDQPALNISVQKAAVRIAGESWRWSRTGSPVDISPLVAATVAMIDEQGPKAPHFYA